MRLMHAGYNVNMIGEVVTTAIKEGDFYLWNPTDEIWTFLGTAPVSNSNYAMMKWYVPTNLPLTSGYKIKGVLRDYRGNQSEAKEWGPFAIMDGTAPTFSVTAPNGGEEWYLGTTNTIRWNTTSTGGVPKVNIYYEYPNSYNYIKSNVDNIGSYDWYIPYNSSYAGDKFKIRVSGSDGVNYLSSQDSSDNYFTIKDSSPKPADPWSMADYLAATSSSAPLVDFGGYQIAYDQQGVAHLVYQAIEDSISTNPRIIVERLYYTKFQNNTWSIPQVAYEKIWQLDGNLTGYLPIGELKLELVGSNPHVVWRSRGGNGGCTSFNAQEIYHLYFNGINWVGPTNLSNNSSSSDNPDLIADSSGNLTVVWTDGRSYDENCVSTGNRVLMYSTKPVGGNWASANSFTNVGYPSAPKLAITSGNKINMVVIDGNTDNIKHYIFSGGNWTNEIVVPSSTYGYYASLKSYNNKLYYVYLQYYNDPQLGNRSRILINDFDGVNWRPFTEISRIVPNVSYDYPSLAIDGDGAPHVMYQYEDNNINRTTLMWSTRLKDNTWLPAQGVSLVSHSVYNSPVGFAAKENNLMTVWTTWYSNSPLPAFNTADLSINYLPPPPVTGLTGESATNSIKLSWNAYVDTDGDFDHFEIWRGNQPVGSGDYGMITSTTNINTHSFVDYIDPMGAPDNYYYVVDTYDTAGNVSASQSIGPIAPVVVVPVVPTVDIGFNENVGGNIFADSAHGQNAQCDSTRCPTAGAVGVSGNGLKFNGTSTVAYIIDNTYTKPDNQVSMEVWIKPEPNNFTNTAYQVVAAKNTNFEITISDTGSLRAGIKNVSEQRVVFDIPNVIQFFQWNHVAITYDGAKIKAYVNGVKVGEKAQTGAVSSVSAPVSIGAFNIYGDYPFLGVIDELKIYKQVLTPEAILANYEALKPVPPSTPDFLSYPFSENTGSKLFFDENKMIVAQCDSTRCPTAGAVGVSGNGLKFNGTSTVAYIIDNTYTKPDNQVSMEVWIKPEPNNFTNTAYQVVAAKNTNFEITISDTGSLRAGIKNVSEQRVVFDIPNVIQFFQWNHVAITYDGAKIKAYVNGVKVGEKAQTGAVSSVSAPVSIGAFNIYGDYPFLGVIDELKIYKQVLTPEAILANYEALKPL